MRLAELEPRWVHANVFVFRCPHCREHWLSCKDVAMSIHDQFELFRAAGLDPAATHKPYVVPMKQEFSWQFSSRDFATMTVTPSIDASKSGHWHGHIQGGEIK